MTKPIDLDHAIARLDTIVQQHYRGSAPHGGIGSTQRYRFVRAFITQLHKMRITLAALATPEGGDAATAVAIALLADKWEKLAENRTQTLSKSWQHALLAVGGAAPRVNSRVSHEAPRQFSNNVRIGRKKLYEIEDEIRDRDAESRS